MLLLGRVWGVFFLHVNKVCFVKNAFACLSEVAQTFAFFFRKKGTCAHSPHEHPGTRQCTMHPCTLTGDTDPKHNNHVNSGPIQDVHICYHLGFCFGLLHVLNFCWSTREVGRGSSWSVAGLGDSGERRVVKQVGAVPSPRTRGVAKQQCSSTCCSNQNEEIRRHVAGRCRKALTSELLDEIREFIVEEHGRISVKNRVKSLDTASNQLTKGSPLSALASVGGPYRAPARRTLTSVIVAGSPRRCWRGWRLHLEGASRGRSQRVDGWIWT